MLTDFHTHILPGIDDGSASLEESLAMLRKEAEQGVKRVVATPHFYAQIDTPRHFLDKRSEAAERLQQRLAQEPDLPQVVLGAEVYYYRGISDSDILSQLTVGRSKYILIEMPEAPWPEHAWQELENIQVKQGLTPIIAHVDRYITRWRQHGIPERLQQLPVLVQANAGFFLRPGTRSLALRMLEQEQLHLLGSDTHNTTTRPPNLSKAAGLICKRLGQFAIKRIKQYEKLVLTDGSIFE